MSNQNNQILDKVGKQLPTNKFRSMKKINPPIFKSNITKIRTYEIIFKKILNKIIYKLKKTYLFKYYNL